MKSNQTKLILLTIFSGLLLGLPFGSKLYFPIAFIAFLPLLFVENFFYHHNEFNKKLAFSYFYLCFIFFNISAAWWTYKSSLTGFFAIIFLNSLYQAFTFNLYHIIRKKLPPHFHWLLFISIWVTSEYIHYNWELAWPWLTLGNGLANQIKLIQWYEFTGVLGGSIWILICNYLLYIWLNNLLILKNKTNYKILLLIFFALTIPIVVSFNLFINYKEVKNPVKIAIIQPNYGSYTEKYKINSTIQLHRILQLSDSIADSTLNYIIAPETAIPNLINQNSLAMEPKIQLINSFLKKHPNTSFIIGVSSYKPIYNSQNKDQYIKQFANGSYYKAYNTFLQINDSMNFQMHHKSKFVLGVEKMPFGKSFRFIEKYAFDLGGVIGSIVPDTTFSPITNAKQDISIAPIICFESVFGLYVTKFIRNNANLIFIITNDDWWGNTPGYKQHLMNASLRAIENRRSIARSANTGISSFINQKGEIIKATKWKETIAIKGTINKNSKLTFYTKYGNYIGVICSVFTIISLILYLIIKILAKKSIKIK